MARASTSTKTKDEKVARASTAASRRAERQASTRRKILDSAARVIGRFGYAGCSVGRVTAKARMAHGTFYLYFKSQQQLFDVILPTLGGEMLASIAEAIGHENDPMEIERRGFAANIAYTAQHPYMNRVLYEAQLFAPKAYNKWLDGIAESYIRSFKRSLDRGPFADANDEQLRMLAIMIINARTALLFRINNKTAGDEEFVAELMDTYLKFVSGGLGI